MINVRTESANLAKKLGFSKVQTLKLAAVGLTKAAYNVQAAIQGQMKVVFDNPTPFVLNSVYVRQSKVSGNDVTAAVIGIRGSTGGKVSPAHALFAEINGGTRRRKMSESLLGRVLPAGARDSQWVPGAAAPRDGFGNVKGSEIKRYISAMQAAMDQGVTSNSRIRGVSGLTRAQSSRILGMAKGAQSQEIARLQAQREAKGSKTKVGTFFLGPRKGGSRNRPTVLYSFKWAERAAKRGTGTVRYKIDVHPVLVFTDPQSYKVRLPIGDIAKKVARQNMSKILEAEALRLFVRWNK